MGVFSKPAVPFDCYEVGHTWTPFCHKAAAGVGLSCFEEGLKIYSSFYLLSFLLSGRLLNADGFKKLCLAVLRSSLFLGCNGFCFIRLFCLCRSVTGGFGLLSSAFIPSFLANLIAIHVESPARRPPLALYMTNVASETIFNMLVARGIIHPIPHGKVLIFSLTLGALYRWFRTSTDTRNLQYKLLKALVGDQEQKSVSSREPQSNSGSQLYAVRHALCPHKHGCFQYSFQSMVRNFTYGWGIHVGASLILSLPLFFRKPSKLINLVTNGKHVRFGAFLATLTGAYRAVHCLLRWVRGSNSSNHSIVAGMIAGIGIKFYPNTSILLYVAWKTLETIYLQGIEAGLLPQVPGFPQVLYSLSFALLFHAALLEPHNLKPTYWKFLLRITGNRMSEMNRRVLDVLGTHSSKLLPDFQPVYNGGYISDEFKSWLTRVGS